MRKVPAVIRLPSTPADLDKIGGCKQLQPPILSTKHPYAIAVNLILFTCITRTITIFINKFCAATVKIIVKVKVTEK